MLFDLVNDGGISRNYPSNPLDARANEKMVSLTLTKTFLIPSVSMAQVLKASIFLDGTRFIFANFPLI
eukprot:gnl/Chilomastix_caulleri/2259.p1 GENE.gnl/Chilomastix_caulleri/2259~~gnl/Chilomastix_caulleri/2259.p1  ORF type:complete len:68 (-),score=7.30 gnl/Chilomastix_caulleri/2259:226-429(-)